jgi:hypothetical protein
MIPLSMVPQNLGEFAIPFSQCPTFSTEPANLGVERPVPVQPITSPSNPISLLIKWSRTLSNTQLEI